MSYDPNARRDTPLALKLKERIRREGPITVASYMQACLNDPEHGYYVKQPAIGAKGDFVTAPEISQIFGELIGLWCVAAWQQMGEPDAFNLVELGPGRGTLMRDAVRAMAVRPNILKAVRVIMIETSGPLTKTQKTTLSDLPVPLSWPGKLTNAHEPGLPAIFIGNEFLDTEPVEQFVCREDGWTMRTVELDEHDRLIFSDSENCSVDATADLNRRFQNAKPGDICELHASAHDVIYTLVQLPSKKAALFIDYGHPVSAPGDTLQAVRAHKFEHPLTSPGEADITAQVDFSQIGAALQFPHLAVDGPIAQAEFLGRLGIIERASKLMSANPSKAHEIEAGVARLIAPNGMGSRFKAIGVRSATLPVLPGFET